MTLKVTVKAQPSESHRAVYRIESLDDSGHATNGSMSPWFLLPHGVDVENYVHKYQRVVIEEYDQAKHGELKETT